MNIEINIDFLYSETQTAKLSALDSYIQKAKELVGERNEIVLTGIYKSRIR